MEDSIDKIAHGEIPYKQYLTKFYKNDFEIQYRHTLDALTSSNKNKVKKKQEIGKEEIEITDKKVIDIIHDKTKKCILRTTRYGPVIEIRSNKDDVKSDYINLKPYMQETNKPLDEITPKEISVLLSLPLTLKYNNKMYEMLFGRYGFYLKGSDKNYKIYRNLLPLVMEGKYQDLMRSLKL